jgi:hypothetical protein
MTQAYTPGLVVTRRIRRQTRRVLPVAGQVLVALGQRVDARDVVARADMPGDVFPLNLANLLSIPAVDVPQAMLKREGDAIRVGEPLARTKGMFGYFQSTYESKVAGTIESISQVTGQVIVRGSPQPIDVLAYLTGEVVDVIPDHGVVVEADVALVQGIFGVGGEAFGTVRVATRTSHEPLSDQQLTADMRNSIVIAGGRVTATALAKAREIGASAVVAGGIDDQDLSDLLGYDLGMAITGTERIGLTVIITEGFGDIAMAERTFELFQSLAGRDAACDGATQIRAGVIRPHVVVPLALHELHSIAEPRHTQHVLKTGTTVRLIRDPYFGLICKVMALPAEPRELESGSKARVVEVCLADGKRLVVPRANVELIEA